MCHISNRTRKELNPKFSTINERHSFVSNLKTPDEFVEPLGNFEYPKLEYMQQIADIFYPGWTIEVLEHKEITDPEGVFLCEKALVRLRWQETNDGDVFFRIGDHVDMEDVMYSRDKWGQSNSIVDLGNNAKGAITRAIKKAMNTYLNICDDIYRRPRPVLSTEELEELKKRVLSSEKLKEKQKIKEMILNDIESALSLTSLKLNRARFSEIIKLI